MRLCSGIDLVFLGRQPAPVGVRQWAPPASTGTLERCGLVSHTSAISITNNTAEIQKMSVAPWVAAFTEISRSTVAQAAGSGMPCAVRLCTASVNAGLCGPVNSVNCE